MFTHKNLTFFFNDDNIIEVRLVNTNPVLVSVDADVEFTYSVAWYPTSVPFNKRFDVYLDSNFFEHEIHWFSIFNSFMMVVFLTGLVVLILMRALRKDIARFTAQDDEEQADLADDFGWKQVQRDVFREPSNLALLAASLGSGVQVLLSVTVTLLFAVFGTLYTERGSTLSVMIGSFALFSFAAGHTSSKYYSSHALDKGWIGCFVLTAGLFPGFCVLVSLVMNFVAIYYKSLAAIPFGTMVVVALIWVFVCFPLCLFGTMLGRHGAKVHFPCRVNPLPKPIPPQRWYLRPTFLIPAGGVLPFGSIFIETYFIFACFWNYRYYYVYGFSLLVGGILLIVCACVTIVVTYFLLNAEDHRWAWTAFLASGSTSLYVFGYSIYYFIAKTHMTGFFQLVFYFGNMTLMCFGLALLCGAIGFIGSKWFVFRIYRSIKGD